MVLPELEQEVYRQFALAPLEAADEALYVDLDPVRGKMDVDFPDVLIAIVRQMAAQLKEAEGIDLKPGYFKQRLEKFRKYLGAEIDLDAFALDAGLLKLSGAIKSSPDARTEIRNLLEPDTNNWLIAANDVISQAALELNKKGKQGLVILVDDLDKMVVRQHQGTRYTTDEYLFVNRAAQLTAFHCHVVYTMPLSLAYSHQAQAIRSNYGDQVPVVPMTRITDSPPDAKPYQPGIEAFWKIIEQRLKEAGAEAGEVFADDKIRAELIALSGGQPTELMTLVREAIIADGLPIGEHSLARAKVEGRREYARLLRDEHWPIIQAVRERGDFSRTNDNDPPFRELLDCRAILQYVNDREWYGLNPMVAALDPPKQ